MNKRGQRGLGAASQQLIEHAQAIIAERAPISVRGVCYRLFVQGWISSMARNNTQRVGRLLVYAREHGLIAWDAIVDESRAAECIPQWDNLREYGEAVARSYRRDYWQTQPYRIEVWSEKATVGGILRPVTENYGVPFLAVHGFGSATSLHDAAQMSADDSRTCVILYVGDHDPSGCHMSEVDLPERFARYGGEIEIRRLALEWENVQALPSFKAKTTDPRYKWYRSEYGMDDAWELDAMDPNDLRFLVETGIRQYIDFASCQRAQQVEKSEQETTRTYLRALGR